MALKTMVLEQLRPDNIGKLLCVQTFEYSDPIKKEFSENSITKYVGKLKYYNTGSAGLVVVFEGLSEPIKFQYAKHKVELYTYEVE